MREYSNDIVFVSVPETNTEGPYLAPFLLKAAVQNNGFKSKAFDFNKDHHNNGTWVNDWLNEIKHADPKWVGISFMNRKQIDAGKELLSAIRQSMPHVKIVAGGYCVGHHKGDEFGVELTKKKLVDHLIKGEGEEAIVDLLNGIYSTEYTTPVPIDKIPIPDYSDVIHHNYDKYFITGSRGCPMKCTFCTENMFSKYYRYRSADSIISEMTYVKQQTGVNRFYFADSLVNGNPKQFRELISRLPEIEVKWQGYFSCLNIYTREDYENAAKAGLVHVSVGVESGSETIRKEMGKTSTNESLYKLIGTFADNGVDVTILLIVGWPTETEENFEETLQFITNISKYDNLLVQPGTTLLVGPEMITLNKKYKLIRPYGDKWRYGKNTKEERKKRWLRLVDHCKKLNVSVSEQHRKTIGV